MSTILLINVVFVVVYCNVSISDKKEPFFSVKEDKDEQKEFETGPLSILMQSVKQNTQVSERRRHHRHDPYKSARCISNFSPCALLPAFTPRSLLIAATTTSCWPA